MAKFPFKRPRIISKKFPELDSSIDGVKKSLNDLVFSYHEQIQNALSKKHWMMAFSSVVLLLVLGSFISIRGKAETSVFYPETCLGGWINPENAQGEQQTTSNGDESQFTKDNSAVLPKNTNAEMYCGNFKGKFDASTKPTKIMVSLALTKGSDLKLEDTLESGLMIATSSADDSATLQALRDVSLATSTLLLASSTLEVSSSTASSTETTSPTVDTAIATPGAPKNEGPTIIDGVIESVQDTINDLFGGANKKPTETDTVIIPLPVPAKETPKEVQPSVPNTEPVPVESPTSRVLPKNTIVSHFITTVFAKEVPVASQAPEVQPAPLMTEVQSPAPSTGLPITEVQQEVTEEVKKEVPEENLVPEIPKEAPEEKSVLGASSSTENEMSNDVTSSSSIDALLTSTTTDNNSLTTSSSTASSTDMITSSSTQETATSTEDNQFQNNFLEVFYTFDGVTWISLGVLNEISMKYRTFEIPVTASTSWNDLSKLQVRVEAKKQEQDTPTVYLDGIKVEVVYETDINHTHPDFSRDTILEDVIIDGIRIASIINHETKEKEIWYMVLEDDEPTFSVEQATSTQRASSTELVTSTSSVASSTDILLSMSTSTISESTSTYASTSSSIVLKNNLFKRVWKKYHGSDLTLSATSLVEEIKKQETSEKEAELDIAPSFASDTIKKMKGVSSRDVLVQIERGTSEYPRDELWLFDTEKNTEERIGKSTTTNSTIAVDSPIGVKGGYLFWISIDKDLVYAYNLENKTLLEEKIPSFNADKGERAELYFSEFPWKVIIGDEDFYFNSTSTGEVFSDDNGSITEAFRQKLQLDTMLNDDELSNLNLKVDGPDEGNGQ